MIEFGYWYSNIYHYLNTNISQIYDIHNFTGVCLWQNEDIFWNCKEKKIVLHKYVYFLFINSVDMNFDICPLFSYGLPVSIDVCIRGIWETSSLKKSTWHFIEFRTFQVKEYLLVKKIMSKTCTYFLFFMYSLFFIFLNV